MNYLESYKAWKKIFFSIYIIISMFICLRYKSNYLMFFLFVLIPLLYIFIDLTQKRKMSFKDLNIKKNILYILLLLFANLWISYNVVQKFSFQSYSGSVRYMGAFLFLLLSVVLLYEIIVLKSETENIFYMLCISLGVYMMLFLPVRMVPDEAAHIYTAYRESEIMLGHINSTDDIILMRQTDRDMFEDPIETQFDSNMIEKYYEKMEASSNSEYTASFTLDSVLKSNDIAYWLPAVGISIGKILCLNGFYTLMLGRLFNLLLYVTLCYWAVKLIPFNKFLPCAIAMLPIALQQGMSFSYDALIIGSSLFVIGGSLYLYFYNFKNTKLIACVLIFSLPLIMLKSHAYFMVGILPLILFLHKKYSLGRFIKPFLIFCLILFGTYIMISLIFKFSGVKTIVLEPSNPIAWTGGEQGYTIQFFINHPINLLMILVKSIITQFQFYLRSGTCSSLGWLMIVISDKYVYAFTILMLLASIKQTDCVDEFEVDNTMKVLYGLVFSITSIGVIFGLILAWTPLSSSVVMGMQGRYFIPVYITVGLLLRNNKLSFKHDYSHLFCILELFVMICFFTSFMMRF